MPRNTLEYKLPYWHFHHDFMVFMDGSLGVGFKINGADISSASNESINNLSKKFESLLVSTNEGLKIQLIYDVQSNVDESLNNHINTSIESIDTYKSISKARFEQLEEIAHEGGFYNPGLYVFIRGESKQFLKKKFWQKQEHYEQVSKELFQSSLFNFERQIKTIESSLRQMNFNPIKLNDQKWFEIVFDYFNSDRRTKVGIPSFKGLTDLNPQSFSSQVSLTDIFVDQDAVKVGNMYTRCVSLKTLPEGQTQSAMAEVLTKLPFHYKIVQTYKILDQKKEADRLQLQRRLTNSMASGNGHISDIESESQLEQIEGLIRELLEGSEKLVSMETNVYYSSNDKEKLDQMGDEILKVFRQMGGSEGVIETLPTLDLFFNNAPGICGLTREKKLKSSNASHLTTMFDYWRGNKRPVCLLPNRDCVLFSIDPFAKELPNWNGLIFGGSGAGKSFTICQLMLQFYGQNPTPKIVWIDNGASSETLLEVLDGEFINLNLDSNICLNMFDLQKGEKIPSPTKVKLILGALESIFKEDDANGLPKREKALLEEAIFLTYYNCKDRTPTLSNFKETLKSHPNKSLKDYAEILYSWTGNTAYGKMLDGQTNIQLSKDLVTIEIKGLDTYPDLQNVFLLLLTDFIKNEAANDLKRPYLLIIDEAWKLFETKSGLSFTLEAYRTFRKFNGGIWCISQNYKDFLSSQEIKNAIFPNTTSIFVLRQRKIDWKDFQEAMDLNDNEIEVIKSLEIVKGKYSEFYFLQDENRAVLRLTPDPLSYWICTSDGHDKSQIQEMQLQFPQLSKIEILKKLSLKTKEAS
jgi:type IV secretory pathway VirB4 component